MTVKTVGEIVDFPAIERAAHALLDVVDIAILCGTALPDSAKYRVEAARRITGRAPVDPDTVSDLELARLEKRVDERLREVR